MSQVASLSRVALVALLLSLAVALPSRALAAPPAPVSGSYTVALDSAAMTRTARGGNCLVSAPMTLTFTGGVAGTATGTAIARVAGSCDQASLASARMVTATMSFTGTINGAARSSGLVYRFTTTEEGTTRATIRLVRGGGMLKVESATAQGGTYTGRVR